MSESVNFSVTLDKTKTTRGTVVYGGDNGIFKAGYIQKDALGSRFPNKFRVTWEEVGPDGKTDREREEAARQ